MPTAQLANRLHILFVIIVIGIALYFYFIYREIRAYDQALRQMQQEIVMLKQSIQAPPFPAAPGSAPLPSPSPTHPAFADAGMYAQDEDEDESVCIEEIQNILDHMSEGEDAEAPPDAEAQQGEGERDPAARAPAEPADSTKRIDTGLKGERGRSRKQAEAQEANLLQLTPEELEQVKTDKLKKFLKSRGEETKGARKDLIDRILTLAPN